MKVLLVTTWEIPCGIAEHSSMLKEAVERADPGIQIIPDAKALDPRHVRGYTPEAFDLIHLNYQASLHSRWTPEQVAIWKEYKRPVVITYHDTGVPNSDQCKALYEVADAFIVHEPADDLPDAHYWRMGVPAWEFPYHFGKGDFAQSRECFKAWQHQPVLGSIGFPFPWKHYDKLAEVTAEHGWALMLLAPTATKEQIVQWETINPNLYVRTDFVNRHEAISLLAGCDATAFCYVTHNTGQSGAVLQGIAARKPVLAFKTCRQFRALYDEYPGSISWCETYEDVALCLKAMPLDRVSTRIVYVAERESWSRLGNKYALLYRSLL